MSKPKTCGYSHTYRIAEREWQEAARLHAESLMPIQWDRKDQILIGAFYSHFIQFITDNYDLIPKNKL